jgi:hypothetical protein
MLRNVSEPTLTAFRPAKPNDIGVIVCSGGCASWRGNTKGSTPLAKSVLDGASLSPSEMRKELRRRWPPQDAASLTPARSDGDRRRKCRRGGR